MKTRAALSVLTLLVALAAFAPATSAKPNEFDLIARHLKAKYKAKKVGIPFMFLARMAVHIVKPAGVKSFNLTLYKDLKFSYDTVDREMQAAMRDSFGPEWSSIFHIRSREGQQAYMYLREEGSNIKVAVVTVEKDQAAVIRVTFSPDRLADFINDPSIFGISLKDHDDNKPPDPPQPGN